MSTLAFLDAVTENGPFISGMARKHQQAETQKANGSSGFER
jgi:hypothetical protein